MINPTRFILFLLLVPAMAAAQDAPATRPTTEPQTPTQRIDDMLKPPASDDRMLYPQAPTGPDATSGTGAVAPKAPVVKLLPEGTYIVDRTGRLTRGADGKTMEFAFEADGQAMADPPLILLPNSKLAAMEDAVSGDGRDLRFRVTGAVTAYRNRNYLLLERVLLVTPGSGQF